MLYLSRQKLETFQLMQKKNVLRSNTFLCISLFKI
jgi:hypothetical protein